MAKKSIGDINGWVFIGVGFIVIAVSIFFYDTLKIFIAIGGIMTLYGMAKLSYDQLKAKIFPKDEDESPVNLDKTVNPYLQQEKTKQAAHYQQIQQRHIIQQQVHHAVNPQQKQPTHIIQQRYPAQQQTPRGRYCHVCGAAVQLHHRFCSSCGTQILR